jgi:hypothetical protein
MRVDAQEESGVWTWNSSCLLWFVNALQLQLQRIESSVRRWWWRCSPCKAASLRRARSGGRVGGVFHLSATQAAAPPSTTKCKGLVRWCAYLKTSTMTYE